MAGNGSIKGWNCLLVFEQWRHSEATGECGQAVMTRLLWWSLLEMAVPLLLSKRERRRGYGLPHRDSSRKTQRCWTESGRNRLQLDATWQEKRSRFWIWKNWSEGLILKMQHSMAVRISEVGLQQFGVDDSSAGNAGTLLRLWEEDSTEGEPLGVALPAVEKAVVRMISHRSNLFYGSLM